MISRYIGDRLVYSTDWWSVCCPIGHALREVKEAPNPKNAYLVSLTNQTIVRKVCCPPCYEHYLNHPAHIGFASLSRALSNLKTHQITEKLTQV